MTRIGSLCIACLLLSACGARSDAPVVDGGLGNALGPFGLEMRIDHLDATCGGARSDVDFQATVWSHARADAGGTIVPVRARVSDERASEVGTFDVAGPPVGASGGFSTVESVPATATFDPCALCDHRWVTVRLELDSPLGRQLADAVVAPHCR